MSRAVNINASPADVTAMAAKHGAAISAIEPIYPTGTRVVLMNADGAAIVARAYKSQLLTGRLTRTRSGQARCE